MPPLPGQTSADVYASEVRKLIMWMVSTGGGNHFVGKRHFSEEQLANMFVAEPLTFHTANGNVLANKTVLIHVGKLAINVPVYMLETVCQHFRQVCFAATMAVS